MNTRVDWVDYAKAIGIVLVVYGHVARGVYNAKIDIPLNLYTLADSVVYSFHMPLFFFLSGLFFYHSFSKEGGGKLLLNKVDSIVYPYLVWSILQGTVEATLSSYTNGNVTFNEVFSLWEPRAQFWFLYALFLVFAVCAVIFSVVSEKFSIFILVLASLLYISSSRISGIPLFGSICNNLVFFVFGIVFTRYRLYDRLSSPALLVITAVTFTAAQYLFHWYLAKVYTDKGVESLILALISILFVVSLSVAISKNPNRFFAFVGASSMAIYLMHILAGSGVRVVLLKGFGIDSAAIHLAAGSVLGVLLPLMAFKVVNNLKIPYVFVAPISKYLRFLYNKAWQWVKPLNGGKHH